MDSFEFFKHFGIPKSAQVNESENDKKVVLNNRFLAISNSCSNEEKDFS